MYDEINDEMSSDSLTCELLTTCCPSGAQSRHSIFALCPLNTLLLFIASEGRGSAFCAMSVTEKKPKQQHASK